MRVWSGVRITPLVGIAGDPTNLSLSDSGSVRRAELDSAFVLMQYFGYLRCDPTEVPDVSDDGYQFWLQKLDGFGGDFISAEMVNAFITSGEYRQRLGL